MSGWQSSARLSGLVSVVLGAASLTACAGPSIHSDVTRVQDLSRVEHLTQLVELEVDPVAAEDAQRLLAGTLDADTAVRVALLNNRELRATLRELGVARGHLMQAGVLPNPAASSTGQSASVGSMHGLARERPRVRRACRSSPIVH